MSVEEWGCRGGGRIPNPSTRPLHWYYEEGELLGILEESNECMNCCVCVCGEVTTKKILNYIYIYIYQRMWR